MYNTNVSGVQKYRCQKYRVFISFSPQRWRWRVDCERTTDYRSRISYLNLTSLFGLFVFLLRSLTSGAFTIDSSTPALRIKLTENPIYFNYYPKASNYCWWIILFFYESTNESKIFVSTVENLSLQLSLFCCSISFNRDLIFPKTNKNLHVIQRGMVTYLDVSRNPLQMKKKPSCVLDMVLH
jgi:hypothetical protein